MDKEQARFILASFRPDGADARDEDFAEALSLAAEDRELGEWLARERSLDAEFARALAGAEIAESLRESILLGMNLQVHEIGAADSALDSLFIGALAGVHPPAALRANILTAMQASATVGPPRRSAGLQRWLMPLGAAAVVMLGGWLALQIQPPASKPPVVAIPAPRISTDQIMLTSIRTLEAPGAHMEMVTSERDEIDGWLALRKLPAPLTLPSGLRKVPCLGCRTIVVDGYRGSMVCYDSDAGPIHLVVFNRPCVLGSIPNTPVVSEMEGWTVAKWCDGRRAYIMLTRAAPDQVNRLF